MAKLDMKAVYIEAGLSLLATIVVLGLVKYIAGKSVMPESWIIVFLLILIYLRMLKK